MRYLKILSSEYFALLLQITGAYANRKMLSRKILALKCFQASINGPIQLLCEIHIRNGHKKIDSIVQNSHEISAHNRLIQTIEIVAIHTRIESEGSHGS